MESSLVIFTNQDKPCKRLSTQYDNTVNKYTFYNATSSSKHFYVSDDVDCNDKKCAGVD